jgi:hypothetical protein
VIFSVASLFTLLTRFAAAGGACTPASFSSEFLFFPPWYEFLPGIYDANGACVPQIININDIWLIVLAVCDILLRVVAIAAIAMMVYGGFQFITSNGNPDQASKAQRTLLNAIIGLVIALAASSIIQLIAGKF